MTDNNKPLNLDELFGQASAVKVIWQGKTYELMRMEAISPKQAVKFNKLRVKANALQNVVEDMNDKQGSDLEKVVDEMLSLLSRELPVSEMPFAIKLRTLVYYTEQTQGKKVMELALGKVKARTGARSSRG